MLKNQRSLALLVAVFAAVAASAVAQEAKLIAVLRSGAGLHEKSEACRQLGQVGTKESVPVLAGMLADEKLSHMARNALETIRDPSVDDALRDALGKLKGRPLLGVIGSLGVRRDAKSVEALAKLLAGPDADAAEASARALGVIGTPEAATALEAASTGPSGAKQLAVYEGLFRAAEALRAEGHAAESQAIYDRLRGLEKAPPQVRAAALRGAILARGKAGVPLLIEALRGSDRVLIAAAVRTGMELPGTDVTAGLCEELPKLPGDKQVLLVNVLGCRGDASAGAALLAIATAKGNEAVRRAAIENLARLTYAPALPLLAELALSAEGELAATARTCLGRFPGKDADATIQSMLSHRDAKIRALAVEMIGQRSAAGAVAGLLRATSDADEAVRLAALKTLRQQVRTSDLPALLDLLTKARSPAEIEAAESAVAALCARESKPAAGRRGRAKPAAESSSVVEAICGALGNARGEARPALLRTLRIAGGPKALETVKAALADNDPATKEAAARVLCDWPTADALPVVIDLVKNPPGKTTKTLALRGLVRLVQQDSAADARKFAVLKDAMAAADGNEEKQLLLSALGQVATADALALVAPHLDNPGLKEEACLAAVAIGEKLSGTPDARVAAVMDQVAKTTANKPLAERAKAIAGRAKK